MSSSTTRPANVISVGIVAAGLLLSACSKKSCTEDDLSQKATDLMIAVQAFGAANPDRMTEFGPKVADLVAQSQGATGDLQPLCDAIDALMAEIGK